MIENIEKPIIEDKLSKADKLVNNLNDLFNVGSKILNETSKYQTEKALEKAKIKISLKQGKLDDNQIYSIQEEIKNESGLFANVDKVSKKINSKLALEKATVDFTELRNKIEINWNNLSDDKKKQFAGKSDYFNSVFDEYNNKTFEEHMNIDLDYALKYSNNLNSFKPNTLSSFYNQDKIRITKEESIKNKGIQLASLNNNISKYIVDEITGEIKKIGEDNPKIYFNQLKNSLIGPGNEYDKQKDLLNNVLKSAIMNNNIEVIDKIYNSDLINEDVKKSKLLDVEKTKNLIRSNIIKERKNKKEEKIKKDKYQEFKIQEIVKKDAEIFVDNNKSKKDYIEHGLKLGIKNVNSLSSEYDKQVIFKKVDENILNNNSVSDLVNSSYKHKDIVLNRIKEYGNKTFIKLKEILNKNIDTNKPYEALEYQNGFDSIIKNMTNFVTKEDKEVREAYLSPLKSELNKTMLYTDETLDKLNDNEILKIEQNIKLLQTLKRNNINITNKELEQSYNMFNLLKNDFNINTRDALKQANDFNNINHVDGSHFNNFNNNPDLVDFLNTIDDKQTQLELKKYADLYSTKTKEPLNVESLKKLVEENNLLVDINLDYSGFSFDFTGLSEDKVKINLKNTDFSSPDEYNFISEKLISKKLMNKDEYLVPFRQNGEILYYIKRNINKEDNQLLYGNKKMNDIIIKKDIIRQIKKDI